jgi:SAM-dependent methyltransferase
MSEAIRSVPAPDCPMCGAAGRPLYAGLHDRTSTAPGTWGFRACTRPDCGLLWLDPMPAREDIHKAYTSYYTHNAPERRSGPLARLSAAAKRGYLANRYRYYPDASLATRLLGLLPLVYPGRAAELDISVMWLHAGARGRLLDIGSGDGWLVAHMRELGWDAEGLDFDAGAIRAARSRGVVVHQGSLHEQRFPDRSFDAITMSHSIEHLHDPLAWLQETRRVLKQGGRLAIATPNSRSLSHAAFREHWFALEPPRHLHIFNADALAALLRRAGFERLRVFTSVRDANARFIAGRAIRRTGRHDVSARPSAPWLLWGRMMQLREAGVLLFRPDRGEDLVAVAER